MNRVINNLKWQSAFDEDPTVNDPRIYNEAPKAAMAKLVKEKILMCKSEGKL